MVKTIDIVSPRITVDLVIRAFRGDHWLEISCEEGRVYQFVPTSEPQEVDAAHQCPGYVYNGHGDVLGTTELEANIWIYPSVTGSAKPGLEILSDFASV